MAKDLREIERKFLVLSDDYKKEALRKTVIQQGFLNTDPERTVRIRIREGKGYITVKGNSGTLGLSRFEWEKEISINDAQALYYLCEPGKIEKIRYEAMFEGHLYEIDEFKGENKGLIIAEIELESETETFGKPHWLGKEVTGDTRFYNSYLCQHPYRTWGESLT